MFNFFVEGHAYVICVYHVKASLKKESIYLSIYLSTPGYYVCLLFLNDANRNDTFLLQKQNPSDPS